MDLTPILHDYREGERALPSYPELAEIAHTLDTMAAALRTIIELSSNAPGREVFANIAFEALASSERRQS